MKRAAGPGLSPNSRTLISPSSSKSSFFNARDARLISTAESCPSWFVSSTRIRLLARPAPGSAATTVTVAVTARGSGAEPGGGTRDSPLADPEKAKTLTAP